MARKTYIQNVEVRFVTDESYDEEFEVFVDEQLVGAYNSKTNTLFVESQGALPTLGVAIVGAVRRQFKVSPEVIH